jgi:hypothetical protein
MLSGLARGDDVYDLMGAVAPNHVPGNFTPDVALLYLAVTALGLACPPGAARVRRTARAPSARGDRPGPG